MSLFNSLGRRAQVAQFNPLQMVQQLQANPAQIIQQAGYSVPSTAKTPQEMINHLVQSGQIPQERLQMAQRMMSQMGFKT